MVVCYGLIVDGFSFWFISYPAPRVLGVWGYGNRIRKSMKQRIYIDTSVFGGYFDTEFSDHTIPLFDRLMNNEYTPEKQFDAVKFMRQQRDNLTEKLSKMTKSEIIEYFKSRKTETMVKPCA